MGLELLVEGFWEQPFYKWRSGDKETAKDMEKRLDEAMELATQQVDPVRPHRPLPSDPAAARKQINRILLDLQRAQ